MAKPVPPAARSVEFLAQFSPGRGAVSFDGTDGCEMRLFAPDSEKAATLQLPAYFLSKKLRVRVTVEE